MKFQVGDEVLIVDGDFKGQTGTIVAHEEVFEMYIVHVPDISLTGHVGCKEEELELLPELEDEEPVDEIAVPRFGMSETEFVEHLEYLLGRSLGRIATTGPEEAFFGFQEFEGLGAADRLSQVLIKIEEAMALFAQAHILVGRSIIALEQAYGEAN